MIIGTFLFYFIVFLILFASPKRFNKDNRPRLWTFIAIPAILGIIITFFTALKIYFIYKFFVLLFICFIFLLTYWQWGQHFRN